MPNDCPGFFCHLYAETMLIAAKFRRILTIIGISTTYSYICQLNGKLYAQHSIYIWLGWTVFISSLPVVHFIIDLVFVGAQFLLFYAAILNDNVIRVDSMWNSSNLSFFCCRSSTGCWIILSLFIELMNHSVIRQIRYYFANLANSPIFEWKER